MTGSGHTYSVAVILTRLLRAGVRVRARARVRVRVRVGARVGRASARLGAREDLVRVGVLLEERLGARVRVLVRVPLARQLAVRALDRQAARVLLDAEQLVAVVLHAVGVGGDLVVLLLHLLLIRQRLLVLRPRKRQHGREEQSLVQGHLER